MSNFARGAGVFFVVGSAILSLSSGCGSGSDQSDQEESARKGSSLQTSSENLDLAASIEDSGGGPVVRKAVPRWQFHPTTSAEAGLAAAALASVQHTSKQSGVTTATLARLAKRPVGVPIAVTYELDASAIAGRKLPHSLSDRKSEIAVWKDLLRPVQDDFVHAAESLGGSEVSRGWLGNLVTVSVDPAAAKQLAAMPTVRGVTLPANDIVSTGDNDLCNVALGGNYIGIDGDSYRTGARLNSVSSAYNGDSGGQLGFRVRVAVIDAGFPVRYHHSLRFGSGSPFGDRILVQKRCSNLSCDPVTDPGSLSHANAVTQWAVGSVANGSDANCTPTTAKQRSGSGASGAVLLSYDWATALDRVPDNCTRVRLALQDAVANAADVVNMSFGFDQPTNPTDPGCDPTFDCSGFGAAIRAATDSDTLVVAGVGNNGNGCGLDQYGSPICPQCTTSCCVLYPARRPEVLAVGGLDTYARLQDYNTLDRHPESARGGMQTTIVGGYVGSEPLLGLMGPYVVNFTGTYATQSYANSNNTIATGTSFAGPAVAGAVAQMRDGFRSIGWPTTARTLLLNMLLMGDAASSSGSDQLAGMVTNWGAGRLHAAVPAAGWAAAPYWWAQGSWTLQPGTTAYGCINGCNPVPSSVRQYNWVIFHEPSSWTNVPYFYILVRDLDTNAVVRADYSLSVRKRIQLRDSEIAGRRLGLEVVPYHVTSPITMYSGDFYHSNSTGWTYH